MIENIFSIIEDTNQKIRDLTNKVKSYEHDNIVLATFVRDLQKKNADYKFEYDLAHKFIYELQNKIGSLIKENNELKDEIEENEDEIEELNDLIEENDNLTPPCTHSWVYMPQEIEHTFKCVKCNKVYCPIGLDFSINAFVGYYEEK